MLNNHKNEERILALDNRQYYADWLRVMVVLSLVPYHAALTYTGLGEIYIKAPISGMSLIPFIFATMPLDNFFMTLLFFISGMSTFYALTHKAPKTFIKERTQKLLLPFVIGTLTLCPIQAYAMGLYQGFHGSFIEFLPMLFSGRIVEFLGYAHFWYLLYLYLFSLVCYPFFKWCLKNTRHIQHGVDFIVQGKRIFLPIVWIIGVETLLRPHFPGMQILIFDWANDLVYISALILGFFYASDVRLHQRLERILPIAAVMVGIAWVVLFKVYYFWLIERGQSFAMIQLWAIAKGVYEVSMIVVLIVLGRKYFNKSSGILRYLNASSFSVYVYHMIGVTYFSLVVVNWKISAYSKFFITVLGTYCVTFVIFEIIKRIKNLNSQETL